jgi:hypothetical protein
MLAACVPISLIPSALVGPETGIAGKIALGIVAGLICLSAFLFVFPALVAGLHRVSQLELKDKPWTFGTFFSGFRWTWRLAGRTGILLLLEAATVLLALAIGALIGRDNSPAILGILTAAQVVVLSVGSGILLRLLFFSHFLMLDRDCGLIDALRGSWRLSRGHTLGLFGLMLLVIGMVGLGPLVVLAIQSVWPMPIILFVCLLVMGVIAELFALPLGILVLNAGYLMVAGAKPLTGRKGDETSTNLRPSFIRKWLPAGLVGALALLTGLVVGIEEDSFRTRFEKEKLRRRETSIQQAERSRVGQAQERELAQEKAKRLVSFFRDGGFWSIELDDPTTFGEAGAAGPRGTPGPGPAGMIRQRLQRVLVLGPRQMKSLKQTVPLEVPLEPAPGWNDMTRLLEDLPFRFSDFGSQEFCRLFAEALTRGEVEAAYLEIQLEPESARAGASGGVGMGPGQVMDSPSGAGPVSGKSSFKGKSIPLEKAKLIQRERFLELISPSMSMPLTWRP